jgi:hypothetical protein
MAIEIEVLAGKGGWEGSKGNLTGYTYKEAATPLAADDSSGATPSFTAGVSEDDDINGTFALLESKIKLTDDLAGNTVGVVRAISSTDGAAGLEIESILSALNADVSVAPYNGTLSGAVTFYMTVAGIAGSDYSVDPDIATRNVTFPGWYGPIWDNLKRMCIAQQIEIAAVNGRIIFRAVRKLTGNDERNMSVRFDVDNQTIAKAVEVYYYNNEYRANGLFYPLSGAEATPFQVGAGEVTVTSVPINAYISTIAQPIPAISVPLEATTASIYTVIDKDGAIVDPAVWAGSGGSITAAAGNDPDELIITVTGAAIDARAPFRIAMPMNPLDKENKDTFPSLRIAGSGVFFNKKLFTIPTGADPKLAIAAVGQTIDNPFISTVDQASKAGVLAAKNWSGRNKTLSIKATSVANIGLNGSIVFYPYSQFQVDEVGHTYAQFQTAWSGKTYSDFVAYARQKSVDQKLVQAFGNIVGARIPFRDSMYRIRDVQYSEEGLNYTAESDTIAKDFASRFSGVSYDQYATTVAGRTYNDFALAPLYRAPIFDTMRKNVHWNPKAQNNATGFQGANGSVVSRVANTVLGTAFAMKTEFPTGGVTDTGINMTTSMNFNNSSILPNTTYTMSFDIVATFTGPLRFSRQGNGQATGQSLHLAFNVVANVPQRVSFQFTTGSTPGGGFSLYVLRGTANQTGTFYTSKFMITEGTYNGVFSDGDTPGWRWLGSSGNSASSGFEYTLERAAGQSIWLDVEGVGNATDTVKLAANEDRTAFAVYDILGMTMYPTLINLRDTADANRSTRLYAHNTIDSRVFARVQLSSTVGQYQDISLNATGLRTNGRRLGGFRTTNNMSSASAFAVTPAGFLASFSQGFSSTIQHQANMIQAANTADHNIIRTIAFKGSVTDTQLTNVAKWLANKYNVYVTGI